MTNLLLFAQQQVPEMPSIPIWWIALNVLSLVATITGLWKIFEKAGEPGWKSIVPFYNLWVMIKFCGLTPLWFFLAIFPCTTIVAAVVIPIKLGEKFGKDIAFSIVLLMLLTFIGYPLLGFGDAKYQGGTAPKKY